LVSRNIPIEQETRHWDDRRKITTSARSKEGEEDYRYFLEGDIPWILIDSQTFSKLKNDMPESIISKKERYMSKYNIPVQVAEVLSSDKFYSDMFEQAHNESNAKDVANLITTDLMGLVDTNEKREKSKLTPQHLADIVNAIETNKITRSSAKNALFEIVKSGKSLPEVISELDLGHVSDESELTNIVDEIISQEQKAVEEAKINPEAINYLVGKVMQKTKGKADPTLTLNIIKKKLSS